MSAAEPRVGAPGDFPVSGASEWGIGVGMPRLLIALVAVLVAATVATPASAAPGRCHKRDLSAHLRAHSPGAGQRYATLVLVNRSSERCTVYGYPGAQLLRHRHGHKRVPTDIVRDRSRTPRRVTLRPGGRARSGWHWGAVAGPGEPQHGRCEPVAKRIEITPPNAFRHFTIRWRMGPVCEHGRIEVRPFG